MVLIQGLVLIGKWEDNYDSFSTAFHTNHHRPPVASPEKVIADFLNLLESHNKSSVVLVYVLSPSSLARIR